MKDFDAWNPEKMRVDAQEENRWCSPRDMWWCQMGVNVGYEQDGKGKKFLRPVIVLRNFGIHTALIVPLTTNLKKKSYLVPIGNPFDRESSVVVTQIRLIDTKRLVERVGKIDIEIFEKIRKAVKDLL